MKLTASKVAQALDISPGTLTNWYRWYENAGEEKPSETPALPNYTQESIRGPRFWREEDIPQLRKFQEWIPKGRGGVMGSWNAKFWGARGKRALKNKEDPLTK